MADSAFPEKDIPINWDEILHTDTTTIVQKDPEEIRRFLLFVRKLKISTRDPDTTTENLISLFELTQFCLEFFISSFCFITSHRSSLVCQNFSQMANAKSLRFLPLRISIIN